MNNSCKVFERYIKSFIRKLNIQKKSKNTIETYNRTFKSFLEFCDYYAKEEGKVITLKNIKEDDIYAFLEYKNNTLDKHSDLADTTKIAIITHLKILFKHIELNYSEDDDFHPDYSKLFKDFKIKIKQKEPKGLSLDEQKKLLDYLEKYKKLDEVMTFRNSLIIKFMLFGGLRVSEVLNIKFEDIKNEDDDFYKLLITGKGDKDRYVFIEIDKIEDEVETLLNDFNIEKNSYIAFTKNKGKADRVAIFRAINSIYKKAGLKVSGLHILRHTFAKNLLLNKISLPTVQKLLGHSNIETTMIYANANEDMMLQELKSCKNKNNS